MTDMTEDLLRACFPKWRAVEHDDATTDMEAEEDFWTQPAGGESWHCEQTPASEIVARSASRSYRTQRGLYDAYLKAYTPAPDSDVELVGIEQSGFGPPKPIYRKKEARMGMSNTHNEGQHIVLFPEHVKLIREGDVEKLVPMLQALVGPESAPLAEGNVIRYKSGHGYKLVHVDQDMDTVVVEVLVANSVRKAGDRFSERYSTYAEHVKKGEAVVVVPDSAE